MKLFVTGIGTEVGKTVISAVLTEKLGADYWKPVQAGDLDNSDTMKVKELVSNSQRVFHDEGFRLNHPMSPHAAAQREGIEINLDDFKMPQTANNLVIEGAGGLMVPLNDRDCVIDLIETLGAEVVLVSRNYLGSINHTLLSIEALKSRGIPVRGVIFNDEENVETESVILKMTGLKCLGRVPMIEELTSNSIAECAKGIEI